MEKIKKFIMEEEGASAVEYGVMVALIAAVIILAVTTMGTKIRTAIETTNSALP